MRYLVGRATKGWGVFDKQEGYVTGFFATKQEAQEVAMECEQYGRPQHEGECDCPLCRLERTRERERK